VRADDDIERVLLSSAEISGKVEELAGRIRECYGDGDLSLVGLLTGAYVFLSDLARLLPNPVRVTFVRVASYREATQAGPLSIGPIPAEELAGRDVLIVEDIVDTGYSLAAIRKRIERSEPRSVRAVALLDKPSRRETDVEIEFRGFTVPDEFLVGYGLDYAGRYRNLPYIGVLRREVFAPDGSAG